MNKAKLSRDTRGVARTFAAMLQAGLQPLSHTGIVPPVARDMTVHMPEHDAPFFYIDLDVTIAPGLTMPLSANTISRDETMAADLQMAADQIVIGLMWAWHCQRELIAAITGARPGCEQVIAEACAEGLPMKLIEIGLKRQDTSELKHLDQRSPIGSVRLCAKVECLNDLLMPEQELIQDWTGEYLAEGISDLFGMQRLRRDRKILLAEAGASGRIDAFALALIDAAGADLATVLQDLAADGCTRIDGERLRGKGEGVILSLATPSYDGVVQASARLAKDVLWQNDKLVIQGLALPETMIIALQDQPVTRMVQHPLLRDDMIITNLERRGNALHVSVTTPSRFFDARTSRVWQ